MSENSTSRMFKIVVEEDAQPGTMELLLDFVETMDERRLTLWTVMLQRTFVMLTLVGGTGGDAIKPSATRIKLADYQAMELEGRTVARWTFDHISFDTAALRILCNLIDHATYNISLGDEPIGSPIAEVLFASESYAKLDFDKLLFPKVWRSLPFEIVDFEPETGDFDIEIEFKDPPTPDIFDQYQTMIAPWLTTLEKGGFLGHPLQSWKYGLDTSEEPFRRTAASLIIRIRDFYSDYAALDCLYNVLARASEIHPIATVTLGE
jgi:hypothetical protein